MSGRWPKRSAELARRNAHLEGAMLAGHPSRWPRATTMTRLLGVGPAGPLCRGCPRFPGIPDLELRGASCVICRWPAVPEPPRLDGRHRWTCAFCGEVNEHGTRRPTVAAVFLRLGDLDPVAAALPVEGATYGYTVGQQRQGRGRRLGWRDTPSSPFDRSSLAAFGFTTSGELRLQPVFARAHVAGQPVLLVGGDTANPTSLGRVEREGTSYRPRQKPRANKGQKHREPRPPWRCMTRVACTCGRPAPCLHAQALYRHVAVALVQEVVVPLAS